MSSPEPATPADPSSAFCGNCGAPVSATDVTCPACGVLLAAYQAPAGATGNPPGAASQALPGDTSATRDVAAPAPPPVNHRPRSQSPIGDALRRSRESGTTGADSLASDAVADELAEMAADDSALAREVEAEMAGARVTFDGNASVIETERVDIGHPAGDAPVVVERQPAPTAVSASARPVPAQPARPHPRATTPVERPVVESAGMPERRPGVGGVTPTALVRWLPFVIIGCVMLGIGRSLPGFGGVIGFALVIGLIYLLIKVAATTSRKTTSMPRDSTWPQGRSRWRK